MKQSIFACVVFLLSLPCVGQSPNNHDRRNFWFLNETGKEIDTVFVSPHGDRYWGDDVLGRDILVNNEGFRIVFFGPVDTCNYDFKFYFSDGSEQVYQQGRDICNLTGVIFKMDASFAF